MLRAMSPLLLLSLACSGGPAPDSAPGDTAADTAGELSPEALVQSLGEAGPYGVGYTEEEVDYTDPAGQPRTLRLAVWYPSTDTQGQAVQYLGFVDAPGVMRDATVAEGPFPVVVFSHGHMGYAEVSGFLLAHLASHGWLVMSPDRTGNTISDDAQRNTEIYFQRPADISAVIDHVARDWAATVDADHIVGMGHSFGGYTMHALAGAAYDIQDIAPRCYDGTDTSNFCSTMSPSYQAIFTQGLADPRIETIMSVGAGDLDLLAPASRPSIARPCG